MITRVGILGTARITRKLIPAMQKAKNGCVAAIASREIGKAKTASEQWNIPKAYGSYEELLSDNSIDAVYIPLPNSQHLEWVKKAARAKKHILCEKPLGLTAEEAMEAIQVCKQEGVTLFDGFMWPHHPRTYRLNELLENQILGSIQHVHSNFAFTLSDDATNIRNSKTLGGGALYDIGCYCVGAILWAFRKLPKSVSAHAGFLHGVDTAMAGVMDFGDGKLATFHCSFSAPYCGDLQVLGTNQLLNVPKLWNPPPIASYSLQGKDGVAAQFDFPEVDQILLLVE